MVKRYEDFHASALRRAIQQFIQDGWVRIDDAFPRQFAGEGRAILVARLPCHPDRRASGISHGFLEPAGEAGMSHAMLDTLGSALERPEALATGPAGSVYLCHPVRVHAAQMHRGSVPRFMAQPPPHPAEPFKLDRPDEDYSPVEIAIRQAIQKGGNQDCVGGKRQEPTSDTSRYGLNDAAFGAQRRAVGRR